MADTVHVKNSKSGATFDLPKDKFDKIKETEAGVNLREVSAKEKSDAVPPSAIVAEKLK